MQYHRITIPCFRTRSACLPHCQARFCYCTPRLVTNQPERTLGSLRYPFGGDHPSQTTHQVLSPIPGLEHQSEKGGISTLDPQRLATPLLLLPPILHMPDQHSILSYSKGARGLFVPWRVNGIFTVTTISPSSWLRQCPDRYTIRAGRNLPDKEFRYLRTVIVTAAVYWGFNSMLRLRSHPLLTFQHRAGVRPYASSFDLAESCVFGKQSPGRLLCSRSCETAPLIPKLQGYFAEFLNHDSLAHLGLFAPTTCVGLRYGYSTTDVSSTFLGSRIPHSVHPKTPLNDHFRPVL